METNNLALLGQHLARVAARRRRTKAAAAASAFFFEQCCFCFFGTPAVAGRRRDGSGPKELMGQRILFVRVK